MPDLHCRCSTDSANEGDLESMDEGQGESGGCCYSCHRPNITVNVLCSVERDNGSDNEDSGASHDSVREKIQRPAIVPL